LRECCFLPGPSGPIKNKAASAAGNAGMGMGRDYMAKNLSTFAIAEMLHVDPGSVANWIDQNLLKAYRTPGGHRRVATEDLLVFLREHKMPIPPEMNHSPNRILIVDDEAAITQLIARAIHAALPECEILEAHDGFRAGTIIATSRPDVVILDLRMPGMDGYEVCRLIKSQETTRHAEVLAMTAFPSPDSEKQILDCGARVCLSKPLSLETLLKEVRASL
jgi:CheY-like chemotaxis protein